MNNNTQQKKDAVCYVSTTAQVMVEVMVALGIVVIALLGMLSLLTNAIGINRVVADQYIATYLASEGIEVVKNIIDTNQAQGGAFGDQLVGVCVNGCAFQYDSLAPMPYRTDTRLRFDENTKLYSYGAGSDTNFVRRVTIRQNASGDELIVESAVTWPTRGGVEQEVVLEDHFYNWR